MILITGGTGYIGSHTALSLLMQNYDVIIVDNFSNSNKNVLDKVKKITQKNIIFYNIDCCNEKLFEKVFTENAISACIHFAGYKAVGESTKIPLEYYENNINSLLVLLKLLKKYEIKRCVFSSSATVYGTPKKVPITENFPLSVTNPYGRSKLIAEEILQDIINAEPDWSIGILRYFNPIGAHKSGLIGEKPNGIPNNIMPYINMVASEKLPYLPIFGNDYETKDGTGVRDYIHVMDLAEGHISMLTKLYNEKGLFIYNLGTGIGYSVFELIQSFENITGKKIPYRILPRRQGDIAICYANPEKAYKDLHWKAKYNLQTMIEDTWHFNQNKVK